MYRWEDRYRWMYGQIDRQINRQIDRLIDRKKDKHAQKQTYGYTDKNKKVLFYIRYFQELTDCVDRSFGAVDKVTSGLNVWHFLEPGTENDDSLFFGSRIH